MKKFSKWMLGFCSAVIAGATVFATLQFTSLGRETNSPAQVRIQDTPINRETHGATSYAPIIKHAAPSVVNIYSTRTVRARQMNPMLNDPFFRRFFGPDFDDG